MKVLLVEDNRADARIVQEMLSEAGGDPLDLVQVDRLSEALERLGRQRYDAVLLDLGLPDARGLEALRPIHEATPDVPVVVLSGHHDERLAVEAVQHGAQDYLMKGRSDGALLLRSLRYAIERKLSERRIQHLAHHDGLTGLPNRRLLIDRLQQAMARARREGRLLAVLFLDLDDFKRINDSFGHEAGDAVLETAARRLRACVRASDTVARFGGDEFTVVAAGITRPELAGRLATKILGALKQPSLVDGREHRVTASMGIALYPDDGNTPEGLIRAADAAMYRAKQLGRDLHEFSAPSGAGSGAEQGLAAELRGALESGQFALYYQPCVAARGYRLVGLEALLRWRHPRRGLIPPARFVPVAEDTGVIALLGDWVLREACRQVRTWNAARDGDPLRVSVNLSSRELGQRGLIRRVQHALRDSGLEPSLLELEITEGRFVEHDAADRHLLAGIRDLGVRVALDDFGTGFSSLDRLRRLPVDTLKIDRAFVRDVATHPNDSAIVGAIVSMAHDLGLRVISEGVEREEQAACLAALGCDELQGHRFGRPAPPATVAGWIGARTAGARP